MDILKQNISFLDNSYIFYIGHTYIIQLFVSFNSYSLYAHNTNITYEYELILICLNCFYM